MDDIVFLDNLIDGNEFVINGGIAVQICQLAVHSIFTINWCIIHLPNSKFEGFDLELGEFDEGVERIIGEFLLFCILLETLDESRN